jgi:hypothetical protein
MNAPSYRSLAAALVLCIAGTAAADKVTSLKGLKKDAALPAGQAALLIVLDQGTRNSAVKRPKPVTMEIVAVADGTRYRVTDAAQADVVVIPPGKYYMKDLYNVDRSLELRDIHSAAEAFELKAGVLNYAGSWKFSNNMTKTTGTVGLELEFAKPPLDEALRRHPGFVAADMVWLAPFGQPSRALGADAPAPAPTTTAPSADVKH